jgi:hypothetical protein
VRRYRRNTAVSEILQRYPTAGLPLFDEPSPKVPAAERRVVEAAPRAIEVATPTRNLAHKTVTFDPTVLTKKQLAVLEVIREASNSNDIDITNQEIADRLNWSVNRVTGRTFELRQLNKVFPSRRRVCRSGGFVVQAWRIP